MKKKNKGFTLIELISVLVILAILALIVTPLVLNIIRKARVSADKRSIDAYGRSIELAVADYLLDKGTFPTSIEQLTIEYTGDRVECETTKLNSDSSVYLANCTVNGRSVTGYTYGKEEAPTYKAYTVGDQVSYNNVDYYVIADSDTSKSTVTLLKAEPLIAEEIATYSAGTGARTNNAGGIQYHASSNDYATSYIKTTVDAWKTANAPLATEARLITKDELIDNFGYEYDDSNPTLKIYKPISSTPSFVYNSNYSYWIMTPEDDSNSSIYWINESGRINPGNTSNDYEYNTHSVRPVIVISKSALN